MENKHIKKYIGIVMLVIGSIMLISGLYFVFSGKTEYVIYSAPSVIFLSIGGTNIRNYIQEKRKF